jgi:lauroyl/myristoyl acyltransferase
MPGARMTVATEEIEGRAAAARPSSVSGRTTRAPLQLRAFRAAEAVVGALPRPIADGLAIAAADLVRIVRPRTLDGLRANLRHVLPEASEREISRIARRNLRNLARSWVDVLELPTRDDLGPQDLHIRYLERYHVASERGRGCVIVSLHLGAWEQGIAAWTTMGHGMGLLAEALRPPELFEHLAETRRRRGVGVIPIDAAAMREGDPATARRLGAHAMREVMRVLRRGDDLAIAMDRDITGTGEPMRFFDADAPIPLGVVDVAIRAGAGIIPVLLPRRPGGGLLAIVCPEVTYDVDAPRDAEVRRVTAEILRLFELIIRLCPDQWNVLTPIWPEAPHLRVAR